MQDSGSSIPGKRMVLGTLAAMVVYALLPLLLLQLNNALVAGVFILSMGALAYVVYPVTLVLLALGTVRMWRQRTRWLALDKLVFALGGFFLLIGSLSAAMMVFGLVTAR